MTSIATQPLKLSLTEIIFAEFFKAKINIESEIYKYYIFSRFLEFFV